MRKIVPLVSLKELDNYISSGVDAVLMGTFFGATRQTEVFTLDEIIAVNEKIPVIGCFNRFYFEHEISQLRYEIKAMYEGGINEIVGSDLAVMELVHELEIDMGVILDTDTTMTNLSDVKTMHDMGAREVVLGRELTLSEMLDISAQTGYCGVHFFGYQLTSFSRRKHISQYAKQAKLNLPTDSLYWLKETRRDTKYMTLEDEYGTHIFAPDVYSAVHAYDALNENKIMSVYFDVIGIDIEDILFVVRSVGLVDDGKELESIIETATSLKLTHGLLYQETEKGK